MNLYGVLKFVHVLSVVLWIGGVTALWITTLRLARARDYPTVARLLPVAIGYGQRVAGPAAGIVLITGIWMAILGKLFSQAFVQIGIAGIVAAIILGATLLRQTWTQLGHQLDQPNRDEAALAATVQRTTTVCWIYILVMVAVIAVMVLKP